MCQSVYALPPHTWQLLSHGFSFMQYVPKVRTWPLTMVLGGRVPSVFFFGPCHPLRGCAPSFSSLHRGHVSCLEGLPNAILQVYRQCEVPLSDLFMFVLRSVATSCNEFAYVQTACHMQVCGITIELPFVQCKTFSRDDNFCTLTERSVAMS